MRRLFLLPILILLSCNTREKQPVAPQKKRFEALSYNPSYNYVDSVAKRLKPNKKYDYWQYSTYRQRFVTGSDNYNILSEGGNLNFKKLVPSHIDPSKVIGLFEGGHPGFRCNYLVVVEGGKVRYLDTMEQLRDFIGSVDNVEEAILIARSFGYFLGTALKARSYHVSDSSYTLRMIKFSDSYPETTYKLKGEIVEISINFNGFLKTKKIEDYCEGDDCFR